jgi:hypothetical protein
MDVGALISLCATWSSAVLALGADLLGSRGWRGLPLDSAGVLAGSSGGLLSQFARIRK